MILWSEVERNNGSLWLSPYSWAQLQLANLLNWKVSRYFVVTGRYFIFINLMLLKIDKYREILESVVGLG
ncbi:hypothetical protein CTI12_AA529110 [Artemisia annua]|uniref:Uncharacterized protein n=1 Tax=Artemisia annua TaxID=35608 RepID=A0A2U1L568_ARTAN|nr:hypothetical protein CTI12_AA529110 [Artemisia annua]